MKKYFLFILILVIFCTLIGCGSTRPTTQLVREVHTDTLHLSNLRYDSIYICQEQTSDYHRGSQLTAHRSLPNEPVQSVSIANGRVFSPPSPDTLFIHDRTVEYRYRLLRDTVFRTRVDSIPVIREVEVIREVRHIPWWSRLLNWIGVLALILLLARLLLLLRGR